MATPRYSSCAVMEDGDTSHPSSHLLEKNLSSVIWSRPLDSMEIRWWRPIAIHATVFCVYTLVILGLTLSFLSSHAQRCSGYSDEHLIYSPAYEAVVRLKQIENNNGFSFTLSPYNGNPSPENDKAWGDLLKGYNIRISHETLKHLNKTAIPLADGSGDHWGSLSMYHQLHCLKTIRHYIARDYYPDENLNLTIAPGQVFPIHIEHCIEGLRQHVMCQPDLTVWTLDWVPGNPDPVSNHIVDHECVDWKHLEDWVDQRSFSLHENLIRRPDGTVWPWEDAVE